MEERDLRRTRRGSHVWFFIALTVLLCAWGLSLSQLFVGFIGFIAIFAFSAARRGICVRRGDHLEI